MEKHLISKKAWIILIVGNSLVLLCVFLLVLTNRPITPKISILKIQPCSQEDNKFIDVNDFKVDDLKYICAEVETDTYPETLTLIVEPLNDLFDAHAYEAHLYAKKTNISFFIYDELPPGIYRARILYARNTLSSVQFNVIQK